MVGIDIEGAKFIYSNHIGFWCRGFVEYSNAWN